MSYLNIRNALQTRLQAVANMGKVWTFIQWCETDSSSAAFANLFVPGTPTVGAPLSINFWEITRSGFTDTANGQAGRNIIREHEIVLFAYYGRQQSIQSELEFQDLLDAVAENFRTGDRSLGQNAICLPPKVSSIQQEMFGGAPCHCATLRMTVKEVLIS